MSKEITPEDLIHPYPDATRGGPYIGKWTHAFMYSDGAIRGGTNGPPTNPALLAEERLHLGWPWWDSTRLADWQLLPYVRITE